jgi:hypothetical protein
LSDSLGFFSGKACLHGWAAEAWAVGPEHSIYPVLGKPLRSIISEFRLDGVVLKKDFATRQELGLSDATLLEEIEGFLVYGVGSYSEARLLNVR